MSKKLYIKTYGCQMNVYDSQRMVDLLSPLGYEITESPNDADMAILNTCHIREKAEQKVFSDLGRLRIVKDERAESGKEMMIAVGGCVAQAEGAEIIRQAPYVSMVFGPQAYHKLPEMIAKTTRDRDIKDGKKKNIGVVNTDFPVESKFDFLPQPVTSSISSYLSVQEGCDNFCTFCVVPYTRGAEYSRPVTDIMADARRLVSLGTKEITLLGQNVNAFHGISPNSTDVEWGLGRLIYELAEIEGLERIRYTTSHPMDMDEELIRAHGDVPQLMPYLHLPIQSGSNRILELMNRRHTAAQYLDVIEKLRKARSDIAMSSDFIVGFPGETKDDHNETLELVRAVNYAQAYSFKYSIRPGTPAGSMDLQVPEPIKVERLAELQGLLNEQQLSFNQSKVGTIQKVLVDREGKRDGQLSGKTPFMQSVHFEGNLRLQGEIIDVKITGALPNSVSGEIETIG
ncbi:MAG: tRNA (N6-isopentenyl adenosine(37)-C2)-methylthiotransferase MiaB [Candidatus Paracaedibacteraceae bacterium]|nr:tRNA (N6-isopentenyl adenosine(37)-C2)-methylthiotransferase MiaB [Candidatus Paracaedibacteraceae bacterium]